jgi:osmotically-inducible protein OsmY
MTKRTTTWLAIGASAVLAVGCAQTDAGVTTKVKSQLAADDMVKASDINVDTKDKVVTLTGTVESQMAEDRALEIARQTEGVASVVDNITVGATAPTTGESMSDMPDVTATDAGVTAAVKAKLLADTDVGGLKIDDDTNNGIVTLTGAVKSQAEKDHALKLARETNGVSSVNDQLTIGPR